MSDREFIINPDEDEWPFSWIVTSRRTHDDYQTPVLIEAWPTKAHAIHYGRIRHNEGYVVTVSKQIAFTIGGVEEAENLRAGVGTSAQNERQN